MVAKHKTTVNFITKNVSLYYNIERALVSDTFVVVEIREFGYYILFGTCRNEGNHCETTKDK